MSGGECPPPAREESSASTSARLEIQKGGTDRWSDVGPVNLLEGDRGGIGRACPPPPSAPTGASADPGRRERDKSRRKYLPRRAKLYLSPSARTKSARRRNFLFRHSPDGVDTNLLIFLHGAGDDHGNYDRLGKMMGIPQAACLSVHASSCGTPTVVGGSSSGGFVRLPFDLGYTWFEEMDYTTGETLRDDDDIRVKSLRKAVDTLCKALGTLMPSSADADGVDGHRDGGGRSGGGKRDVDDTGWIAERIFLFGYGAGACLAMEACARFDRLKIPPLGGVVCVAGGMKSDISEGGTATVRKEHATGRVAATPVLMVVGSDDETFSTAAAEKSRRLYRRAVGLSSFPDCANTSSTSARIHIQPGKKGGMIASPEETRAVMEFFAETMARRMLAMEGWAKAAPSYVSSGV